MGGMWTSKRLRAWLMPTATLSILCSLALHSEENAILYAAKNNSTIEGATLYVTLSPCLACARVIFTTGIRKVFFFESYAKYKGIDIDEGVEFLRRFNVDVRQYQPQP